MINQILKFYEKKYQLRFLGPAEKIRVKKIVKLVGSSKKVLDVGCDVGLIGQLLLKNKNQVYGLDISPSAVKKARKNGLKALTLNIETQQLPFKNNYFDVVLLGEILEHLFDPDLLLTKIKKKLKRGGGLIITTPNLATLGRRLQLLCGLNPAIETRLTKYSAGHLRYFVKQTLFDLLLSHQFKVIHFSSDLIHLTPDGKLNTILLARLFPTLGRTLIVKTVKL